MVELSPPKNQIEPIVVKTGPKQYTLMTREEFEALPEEMKKDVGSGGSRVPKRQEGVSAPSGSGSSGGVRRGRKK